MDGYSYDSAGNLLYDNVHHYFYDAENRLIQVDGSLPYCTSNGASGSAPTACYYYDARGSGFVLANPEIKIAHRVHRTGIDDNPCNNDGNGGSGDFAFDLDGNWTVRTNSTGGACASEIYLAGRHFGTSDNGSIYFDHGDWLGTSRLRNTASTITSGETCTSLPFGDGLLCNSTYGSNIHFTGKEHDYETGLDDFGARFDASSFGRFMTPDPLGILAGQRDAPQNLNLYSYVENDPVNAVDPDGLDCVYINDNSVGVLRGDCQSDTDDGIYVNGTINTNSFTYNGQTGTLGFNYTNDDTGALGAGVIGNVYPSGGVSDTDRLNALSLAGNMAAPGVNLAANGLRAFGYAVAAPLMVAAECGAGAASCTNGNVAMAMLPEIGALREGALVLKEGVAVGKGAEILQKAGGMAQAAKDFESLQGAEKVYGTTRVKELADGTTAILYDSKTGPPTIAIQDAGRTLTKIRY